MSEELTRSDSWVRKESWTASNETQLKKAMNSKLINLKTSKHEIIKSQHAQAALKSTQSRKLSHHTDSLQSHKSHNFSEQDKCFWLQVAHMSVWSSMRDSHSHYHSLLQICQDKTHTKKFCHRSAEHSDSDQYVNEYPASNKMIHEAMNSVTISADRAAAVWENEDRWVRRKTVRQQDHISCHSREIDITDVNLILQTARESAATCKHIRMRVFMLRDFSHHVN